jgi:hypothetical protein
MSIVKRLLMMLVPYRKVREIKRVYRNRHEFRVFCINFVRVILFGIVWSGVMLLIAFSLARGLGREHWLSRLLLNPSNAAIALVILPCSILFGLLGNRLAQAAGLFKHIVRQNGGNSAQDDTKNG